LIRSYCLLVLYISKLVFDNYSLAQIFNTAAVPLLLDADQHVPFVMHP
jgi:hypothetical protein